MHDVRYVYTDPENELRFGSRPQTWKVAIKQPLRFIFHKVVFDPASLLTNGFSRNNLCVIGAVLICLYKKLGDQQLGACTQTRFAAELQAIRTTNLYRHGVQGLALEAIPKLEALNSSPIPDTLKRIFPQLAFFEGISINVFQIRETDGHFSIFPMSLSQHSRNSARFQIDLLAVTAGILEPRAPTPGNHVLAVPFMRTLVSRCTNKISNKAKYMHLCRSCMTLHRDTNALQRHELTCARDSRRGSAQPRKISRNILIHRPTVLDKFTNKMVTNTLTWKRSDNYRLIKPLVTIYGDLESYTTPTQKQTNNDIFGTTPSRAVQKQSVMSYAYTFKSLYPQIHLPPELSRPRLRFCSQTSESSDRDLFLSFFISLRNDLVRHAKWLRQLLSRDAPPPPPSQRTPQMRDYFKSVTNCQVKVLFSKKYFFSCTRYYITLCQSISLSVTLFFFYTLSFSCHPCPPTRD